MTETTDGVQNSLQSWIDASLRTEQPIHIDEWDSPKQVIDAANALQAGWETDWFDVSKHYDLNPGFSAVCVQGWSDDNSADQWQLIAFVPASSLTGVVEDSLA